MIFMTTLNSVGFSIMHMRNLVFRYHLLLIIEPVCIRIQMDTVFVTSVFDGNVAVQISSVGLVLSVIRPVCYHTGFVIFSLV